MLSTPALPPRPLGTVAFCQCNEEPVPCPFVFNLFIVITVVNSSLHTTKSLPQEKYHPLSFGLFSTFYCPIPSALRFSPIEFTARSFDLFFSFFYNQILYHILLSSIFSPLCCLSLCQQTVTSFVSEPHPTLSHSKQLTSRPPFIFKI